MSKFDGLWEELETVRARLNLLNNNDLGPELPRLFEVRQLTRLDDVLFHTDRVMLRLWWELPEIPPASLLDGVNPIGFTLEINRSPSPRRGIVSFRIDRPSALYRASAENLYMGL